MRRIGAQVLNLLCTSYPQFELCYCGMKWNRIYDKWEKVVQYELRINANIQIMKIEKHIYKIIYRGKRFSLPLYVSEKLVISEKVLVRKDNGRFHSYIRTNL